MIKLTQKSKKLLNLVIGISMATLIVGAMTTTSFAWYIAQSKANIIGNNAVIRNSTSLDAGFRYFTGNGDPEDEYEGYDATTIAGATIGYDDDTKDFYYAEFDKEDAADYFDFSKMQPGRRYSYAFEEVGKEYVSILLSAFTAHVESSSPYKEMYTGPLAICQDLRLNGSSWFRIHDTSLDNTGDPYNYIGYNTTGDKSREASISRERTSVLAKNTTASETPYKTGSFEKGSSGLGKYDVVIYGDMTIEVYDRDVAVSTITPSTTRADRFKLYGYNTQGSKTFGSGTDSPADQATSTFYYVDQSVIDAWNTTGKHTKYISSAALVAGYCQAYALNNTASVNDATASTYTSATVATQMTLTDKIGYRFGTDILSGEASGDTSGESAATYQLGHISDNGLDTTSQIYFLTIAMPDAGGNKLKPICKRENGGDIIYYSYSTDGSYEPYFGIDAGLGTFTLS